MENTPHDFMHRLKNGRWWIVAILIVSGTVGLAIFNRSPAVRRPDPLIARPPVPPNAVPQLIDCRQLPALAGFKSPKPVIAADQQGQAVVLAYGTTDSPLGTDIVAWRSASHGNSWELPSNLTNVAKSGGIEFDPWMESDRRGNFYSVHVHAGPNRSACEALLRKSHDGGRTWTAGRPLPWTGADRPILGISPDGTRLVIAASMFERTEPVPTTPLNPDAPDYAEKLEKLRASIHNYPGVFVSTDLGQRWIRTKSPFGDNIHAIPFAAVVDDHGLIAVTWIVDGEGSSSAVSVSRDLGQTWHETTLVKPLQADGNHPFNGERFPVVARDGAGGLHLAYTNPSIPSLEYRSSSDGTAWSQPVPLSATNAEEIRMAAIDAIGQMVHVIWMERIGSTWHAWYRGSHDSGATWSTPLCLSTAMLLSDGTTANGFAIFGDDDQSSIRDDRLGRIHATWCICGGHVLHAIVEWTTSSSTVELDHSQDANEKLAAQQESERELTLRGEVLLPDGAPAAGATVRCWPMSTGAGQSITTDENGRFEIRDEFLFDPQLHVTTSQGDLQASCQLQAIGLRERVKSPVVITLLPARQHRVVVRASGKPVANAHLYVNQSATEAATTNDDGLATLWIAADQKLHEVSCWHPTLGIGGLSEWQRGGLVGDETVLDLFASTPCTLVVVDDEDLPIPDLTIGWSVRIRQPNQTCEWLHYSDVESLQVRTNAMGEAVIPWMPADGVERINCHPFREGLYEMDEEVDLSTRRVIMKFRSKPKTQMLSGLVELPGGQNPARLLVRCVAWEGTESARVRSDGTFSLPVIPGKFHGVDLADVTWSASGWTGIPFVTTDAPPPDIRLAAELSTRVNIRVTHGADHRPISNAPVYFRGRHELRFRDEAGEKIRFNADPLQTTFLTDDRGEISVGVGPGELELNLQLAHWQETRAVTVMSSAPASVEFHRSWVGQRRIVGRVTLDNAPFSPTATTNVRGHAELGSVEIEGKLDATGGFDLPMNVAFGSIVVIDPDRRLSGVTKFDAKSGELQIDMHPTATFRSQLVDQHSQPIANQHLQLLMQNSSHAASSDVTTDAHGQFQFDDVLTNVALRIVRINAAGERQKEPGFDDERFLDPGETRREATIVIRLSEPTEVAALPSRPLDDSIANLVRDVRLAHMQGLIVIEGDASPVVAQLVQKLLDYDELPEAEAYLPLVISSESLPLTAEYLDRQKWPKPLAGELALVALAGDGTPLEYITVQARDGDEAYQRAATLICTRAPKPLDAIALIEQAREEARQSDRKVLVAVGGARCGACFLLSRWLDDQRDTLAKDFVVVKFDGSRSLRAEEAATQLAIREPSIPFFAITDATGTVLITSDGPLGNIGLASTAEGIRHFRKILETSTRHMTPANINELIQSLEKRRH